MRPEPVGEFLPGDLSNGRSEVFRQVAVFFVTLEHHSHDVVEALFVLCGSTDFGVQKERGHGAFAVVADSSVPRVFIGTIELDPRVA